VEALDHVNKIIFRPNNSLSPEGSVKVVMALFVIVLFVAVGFSIIGAWLVLPFAGIEILALAYAFYSVYLHSDDYESIAIVGDEVIVEKKNDKDFTMMIFQRYWAQISVRDVVRGAGKSGKRGLFISSHGKEVEFGKYFINDGQRTMFARELREKLRNIY
jgi:uncharacterized membrane protein